MLPTRRYNYGEPVAILALFGDVRISLMLWTGSTIFRGNGFVDTLATNGTIELMQMPSVELQALGGFGFSPVSEPLDVVALSARLRPTTDLTAWRKEVVLF